MVQKLAIFGPGHYGLLICNLLLETICTYNDLSFKGEFQKMVDKKFAYLSKLENIGLISSNIYPQMNVFTKINNFTHLH